jgi:hypothetical protein
MIQSKGGTRMPRGTGVPPVAWSHINALRILAARKPKTVHVCFPCRSRSTNTATMITSPMMISWK